MPVITSSKEAEIRRIVVPGEPEGKLFARPHLNRKKLSVVVCGCHPNYGGKHK
jgi:hypothetical protein